MGVRVILYLIVVWVCCVFCFENNRNHVQSIGNLLLECILTGLNASAYGTKEGVNISEITKINPSYVNDIIAISYLAQLVKFVLNGFLDLTVSQLHRWRNCDTC